MEDVDSRHWQKAMQSEIESMFDNKVWSLVDLPKGIKPIGCKWVYKRKRGMDGKVETFKARLVAKGYTQKEGIDYEETFSPVAMLKSIRILLSIAASLDPEIWQMDVKTAFLNGSLDESIYMMQPEGFIEKSQVDKVCKLQKSIYGLKQASRSWNIRFDQAVKGFGFIQNPDEPCVYKRIKGDKLVFLILYVDDILLIGNDVGVLTSVKERLAKQFDMKDLGEASFILGIQVIRDRKNRTIALSQASYIDKILSRFSMQDSKKGMLPFRHGIKLSKEQVPKNEHEEQFMSRVPYASAVGSLMYAMLCTRPDICFAVGIVSRFQSKPGPDHWTAVKHIFKYLKRTRDNMLVYSGGDLVPVGYTDSDFQSDSDSRKSTSGAVFTIGGGAVIWRSIKQSCISNSTMEAEYVAACEAAKEAVWLRQFLIDLEVVPNANKQITIYCDNSGAVANSKEPRSHKRGNVSSAPIDKSRPTISSKISKANKVDELGIFNCKKLIQERGIDLDSCVGSYVYDVLMSRNWNSWVNMLGISNETVVREFYHAYKSSSTVTSATLSIRKVVFRVCSRKVNEFLDLPDDIESEFLDVDILENLDLMGRTLCDDSNFVWGKRAYIKQGELTKISAFWYLFVCSNLVGSTNASELNRDKIKIVYALVTNKPINLGELLVEQIEIAACTSRLDKKLAFPGFITQLCLAKRVRNLDDDVMLPPLEKLSEKRVASMSYKDKGKSNDVFRLFGKSLDSNHVPSSPALPSWVLKLRNEVEESRRLIETSQRKIEDLSAKLVVQDERIKELEGKSTTTRQYVRSSHRTSFLGGTSG
ncbi:hypothetical protein LWI29_028837 [Acer saccharum]|uniref:Reverse transcriptase Ty1/copia-type domain-containing protein n=1 Tax=Acer saccharum TaxID=4024 RepID=A0AA39SKR2_ACESA|nr:hypothetical protein LWI29_028837 [Acer saccharum]